MLEDQQGYRPEVATFTFAGGLFSVVDPAGILANAGPSRQPILHPGSFPPPLLEVAVLLSGGVRDGQRELRFEGRITIAGVGAERTLHPAITGVAYVAPLIGALSRLLAPGTVSATAPDAGESGTGESEGVTDLVSGVTARVTYGRPRLDGRVTHTVLAVSGEPAVGGQLAGFVRLVFDLAGRLIGADRETFLAGQAYTLSRHAPAARPVGQLETVRLEQIGGLDDVVRQLREVADSFNHPEAMARWGARRPQGLLISGPPGTGKTMLATALATEIGGTLKEIRTPDILQKWVGASERNIKRIFTEARRYRTPTVLLFDEFDSIISYAGAPQGSADQAINSVAGIFKQEMNSLVEHNPNIIVVATTNFPERVDESLIRSGRFDVKIVVPLPDARGRADILAKMLRRLVSRHETSDFRMFADDIDVDALAAAAVGLSGADLRELLRRVQMAKAMQEARGGGAPDAITQDDLRQAIGQLRRRQ